MDCRVHREGRLGDIGCRPGRAGLAVELPISIGCALGRVAWGRDGPRSEQGGEHRERAGAAGECESCGGPGTVHEEAGAGCSDGSADCHCGGEPGESLGHRRGRGGVVDHRVDGGFGRRDRGAGEQEHTRERNDAAGRWDEC
jgi:hypothetical protein